MANLKINGVKKAEQVEPVKNSKDIKKIRQYLMGKSNKRDYCLWCCGTNFLLRAGDLLKLKWRDVLIDKSTVKEHITLTEEKTNKLRKIKINTDAREALLLYIENLKEFNMADFIFRSRKGDGHLTVKALHKIIKSMCSDLGIKGNFGSHTLRKTGARKIYADNIADNPMILNYLQKILNHSSQAVTLRYIGIESEEIFDLYDNIKW